MNWLQFLASILDSLAWPICIVTTIALLRKPMIEVVPKLRKLQYKDFNLEFEQGLKEVEARIPQAPINEEKFALPKSEPQRPDIKQSSIPDLLQFWQESAKRNEEEIPLLQILEAWRGIENALIALGKAVGVSASNPQSLIKSLAKDKVISSDAIEMFTDLRRLRNLAVHEPQSITKEQADRYLFTAAATIWALEKNVRFIEGKRSQA